MKKLLLFLLAMTLLNTGIAQTKRTSIPLEHGSHRTGKRTDADMQRWRTHGLGQFIHWGVYAIPGGHWEGKYYGGAAEWIRSWSEMPDEAYDQLYKQFNPQQFDAGRWARQAKEMGVKYLIFTTKHHDGFCLWPSRYTDYTIASSPYKKDIVGEVVKAYTREGIDVHLYFSIIDWNHFGYRSTVATTDKERENYEAFKAFTRNQLIELLTRYPQIKGLWFDGSWDKAWIAEAAWVDNLGKELRTMHPGLIIGSRFRSDEFGKRHYDSNGDLIDDYDQTWERALPDKLEDLCGNDWDCVMTIPENQWGYHSDWRGYVKTAYDLIEMMAHAVSLDGNFVVNFGPDGQGNIRPEETRIATEMGQWMQRFGEAIYGAQPARLKKQDWGYYTAKNNRLYLIVCNQPLNRRIHVEIPKGDRLPVAARMVDTQQTLEIINAGKNKQNNSLFKIAIPENYSHAGYPYVIVLDMEERTEGDEYQQAKT